MPSHKNKEIYRMPSEAESSSDAKSVLRILKCMENFDSREPGLRIEPARADEITPFFCATHTDHLNMKGLTAWPYQRLRIAPAEVFHQNLAALRAQTLGDSFFRCRHLATIADSTQKWRLFFYYLKSFGRLPRRLSKKSSGSGEKWSLLIRLQTFTNVLSRTWTRIQNKMAVFREYN